jgi:hypothetical protein
MKSGKGRESTVRAFTFAVAVVMSTTALADNIFSENTPPGGPYKFESDYNWSAMSLMDPGNWFVTGHAVVDDASGTLTADPQGEKKNFFLGRNGTGGSLTVSGGRLEVLSNLYMQHSGGRGSLTVSGGTLYVEENLAQGGKEIAVSGGTLQVGNTINVQVDLFRYTGGTVQCSYFGISSGTFEFQLGPDTSPVAVQGGLFGGGTLTLRIADGYEPPAGQEILLFAFGSDSNMAWTDGNGTPWQDGKTMQFGGREFTVVRSAGRLAVIPQ